MNRTLALIGTLLVPALAAAQNKLPDPTAAKAAAILKSHCYRCHGENGSVEGGINFMLDRSRLVARKLVLPGMAQKSKLFRRVILGEMPPEGEHPRPSDAETQTLKQWIDAGALDWSTGPAPREFLTDAKVWQLVAGDLEKLPEEDRRFTRYFTLTQLRNANLSEDELTSYRNGISKLVNSLSWSRRIEAPRPIDPSKSILRIDLRHYRWTDSSWSLLTDVYPFGVFQGSDAEKKCREWTKSALPFIRGDWFVAHAALPPFYHELLQLPRSDRELERRLHVDTAEDVNDAIAIRAGFNGSGISRNNRLIERHETPFGAYWKSYDFGSSTGRKNLFASPLGPGPGANTFRHDGGEIIFTLPNGLQGYMLVDGKGDRIDKGPTEIVSDARRPDRAVVNGLSCMSCHVRGILAKDDQIREHVEKNKSAFSATERQAILDLYPPHDRFRKALEQDAARFAAAVANTGSAVGATEPIVALALRFESELDLNFVAGELGIPADELKSRFAKSVTLSRLLGSLAVDGGTVQRTVLTESFSALVSDLDLGRSFASTRQEPSSTFWRSRPSWSSEGLPGVVSPWARDSWASRRPATNSPLETVRPRTLPTLERAGDQIIARFSGRMSFEKKTQPVHAVAIHPQEPTLIASESQPGVVTLWDSRDSNLARVDFLGHRGDILALDFSPDGKFLVTGSMDQTARVWDAVTGREFFVLEGHAGFVNAVRVSPDGSRVATGSERVRLWDLASGKEAHAMPKLPDWVVDVAFSPDSRRVAAVTHDRLYLWDAASGASLGDWSVGVENRCVAFSPTRPLIAVGDATGIAIFDPAAKKETARLVADVRPITAISFSSDGGLLISSAGSVRDRVADFGEVTVWDFDARKKSTTLTGVPRGMTTVRVAPDDKSAVGASEDGTVRVWDLKSFGRASLAEFEGHTQAITFLALSSDRKKLLSASADGTARLWDVATGKQLQQFAGASGSVLGVAFAPDDRTAFTVGADRSLRSWNIADGKPGKRWEIEGLVTEIAIAPGSKWLALNVGGMKIRLFDMANGTFGKEIAAAVQQVQLSGDGLGVYGIAYPKRIRRWSTATGEEAGAIETSLGSFVNILAVSADGSRIAVGNRQGVYALFDGAGKELRRTALEPYETRAGRRSMRRAGASSSGAERSASARKATAASSASTSAPRRSTCAGRIMRCR